MEMQGEGSAIEPGKIFVGGLSWATTEENLKKHFENYGETQDCKIMLNPVGQPRGFGFVTFKDPASVEKVLMEKHCIDDKLVDPKRATLKPHTVKNKVFLGGLPGHCTAEQVRMALSPYGNVVTVDIKTDNTAPNSAPGENKKNRGFAFVDFETEDQAQSACEAHFISIESRRVEAKIAEPRNKKSGTVTTATGNKDVHVSTSFPHSAFYNSGGMGRGMTGGGTTSTPYHYPYYNPYTFSQFPYEYSGYGRGTYAGQQPLTAYQDASSGSFSQHRPAAGYGSNAEHFNGGAGYASYDQSHLTGGPTGYYDQSGSSGYSSQSHSQATATPQPRGNYAYGRS